MTFRRVRYYIFLRDVLILAVTAFGGPQGHLAMFIDMMVKKRGYLSEEELLELFALCQILPGPTSTQTITSIGFRMGGPSLAYLTLLIWMLPAVIIMTSAALLVVSFNELNISLDFLRFIQPMAVGIVAYSAYRIGRKVVKTNLAIFLMILAVFASFFTPSPVMFPVFLLIGGLVTAINYKRQPHEEKEGIKIKWENFILWASVLIVAAIAGALTDVKQVLIFENFYRNGSLIFGGGQVLVPLIYTEFVQVKEFLSAEEFISGYGFVQAIPGPTFSFSAYVGGLGMRGAGTGAQLIGAFAASLGVFLPGTFLIFFVIRFWDQLKKYRMVRASMEGVHAVSSGMVIAAVFLLFQPMMNGPIINYLLMIGTALTLYFTRIPAPFIILGGLILGIVIT
ncbi:MAG: chromate efflux transporter [Cytophagales bacterium]|nr:chromate efflux transporter [Cytophagales bacterium]